MTSSLAMPAAERGARCRTRGCELTMCAGTRAPSRIGSRPALVRDLAGERGARYRWCELTMCAGTREAPPSAASRSTRLPAVLVRDLAGERGARCRARRAHSRCARQSRSAALSSVSNRLACRQCSCAILAGERGARYRWCELTMCAGTREAPPSAASRCLLRCRPAGVLARPRRVPRRAGSRA